MEKSRLGPQTVCICSSHKVAAVYYKHAQCMSTGEAYCKSRDWLGSGRYFSYPTYQTAILVHIQMHEHFLVCRSHWSAAILRHGVRLESRYHFSSMVPAHRPQLLGN